VKLAFETTKQRRTSSPFKLSTKRGYQSASDSLRLAGAKQQRCGAALLPANREKKIVNVPLPTNGFAIGAVPVSIRFRFSAPKSARTRDAPTSHRIPLQSFL